MPYEYESPTPMVDWLKDFADEHLKQANPFDRIKDVFDMKNEATAIEAKVQELCDRVGLNKVATDQDLQSRAEQIKNLITLANQLEQDGDYKTADLIDSKIRKMAEQDINLAKDDNEDKMKELVDKICRARKGLIDLPAVLNAVKRKYPDAIKKIEELSEYIGKQLEETRPPEKEYNDVAEMTVIVVGPEDERLFDDMK